MGTAAREQILGSKARPHRQDGQWSAEEDGMAPATLEQPPATGTECGEGGREVPLHGRVSQWNRRIMPENATL
jgi:hypothetical protein